MCCVVRTDGKVQDNQDKEVRVKYKVRTKKKVPVGADFSVLQNVLTVWGLPWVRFTRYRHSIPCVQRAGLEVDRSYTSGVEVE